MYRPAPDPLTGQKAGLTSDLLLSMVPRLPSAAAALKLGLALFRGPGRTPVGIPGWMFPVLWPRHENSKHYLWNPGY